ncbi:PAS domain-containing protein [Cellvibrio sp. PSBB006]|uniref:PAS domain-containing protein n=1 Tax=Cellvibrio sp. PSBB006 TaxID=1987723 RepID=UPI000B3B8643|nr:PAS domain-containing protein [Cellvibrio sp. PSBB006]ARU28992.1 hypothetical protein CBR65_16950 [Cellvibrio sp. PSBB006]
MKPPLPANEMLRLQALYDLLILDSPREKNFDDITAIASMICDVPMSIISLVDAERQWFKSSVGLDGTETARDIAFCAHAILQPQQMTIVPDALLDKRFVDNPLVTGDPHIRFYAGAPLVTEDGAALGTLCVADYKPRDITPEQQQALMALARQVMQLFHLRSANHLLQRNAENLQSIITGANVGTWEMNVQTGGASFNERWAQMLGYSLEELQPLNMSTWSSLTHKEDLVRAQAMLQRHFQGQSEYYDCQFRMRHKLGYWVWIHAHGSVSKRTQEGAPLMMFGTHVDVTALMESRRALEENEERFRSMLSNLPGAVYRCINDHQWSMQFLSDEVEELTGYPAEDFIDNRRRSFSDITHPDDAKHVARVVRNAITEKREFTLEYRVQRASGQWCWLQEVGRGIFDEQGQLKYLDGFIWDITERKNMEQMKDEFVSTVSHELRTPLTSISGALKLMVSGALGEMPEKSRTMLDIAYKNSQRLTLLINDLLDMEKLLAGKMAFNLHKQPLHTLLEQTVYENRAYGDQYQVSFQLAPVADTLQVMVDEQRFLQVMSNLLSNAAKFSPPGNRVDIRTAAEDGNVRISVVDYGSGIPLEFQHRLFQKFSQADASDSRQKGGTGLGLAITKELLENMNGKISVESQPGLGSCFTISLPCTE